jgi:hypothetical protein
LVIVATLGAGPVDAVPVFSWETASPVVWLEERRQPAGPNAKPPKPFEWKGFFKIRSSGELPANGVFQVDGWPVQPEVEWVSRGLRYRKNAPPVVVGPNSGGQFDLLVREPGRYTFKASVGKVWSAQVTIEARAFPFELGMRQPDFLEKYGNPDVTLPNGRWIYKRWPSLVVYHDRKAGMQAETMHAEEWMAGLMGDEVAARTIVVHAREASIVGKQICYSDPLQSVHRWVDPAEYFEWTVRLLAGSWNATLEYAADANMAPSSVFAISVFGQHEKTPLADEAFSLKSTGHWPTFSTADIGTLTIPKDGEYIIRISVIRKVASDPHMGMISTRSLRLNRK